MLYHQFKKPELLLLFLVDQERVPDQMINLQCNIAVQVNWRMNA